MTVEKVLKLDEFKGLIFNKWSYDAGHSLCICSGCGEKVEAFEKFAESEEYEDGAGNTLEEQITNNFPIRIYNGKGKDTKEAVLHTECLLYLKAKGLIKFD